MSSFFPSVGRWAVILLIFAAFARPGAAGQSVLDRVGRGPGICVVLGEPDVVVDLAQNGPWTVYFQSTDAGQVAAVRDAASRSGLLGTQIFADQGDARRVALADNLADRILVAAQTAVDDAELLRVLHPEGVALVGTRRIVKPQPPGVDAWSHVYHGPDNNPLSTDQSARAPYLTQFLADPKFCPMPEVSVAAGGRVFRAFGHIAHKANQNALLNTLLGINGYNGTILWRRTLREGFMIHRNTMVATREVLYLADDQSCKLLDARTGRVRDEIRVLPDQADGPVWKWLALDNGMLYALVGGEEVRPATQRSNVPGMGHWPWGMWEGHDYKQSKTNFGFGRTLLAIDPATKKILWTHRDADYLDARGVCLRGGRIYAYSPGKWLAAFDARSGRICWKNASPELLHAIGPDGRAQLWTTGYSTTTFIKCTERAVFLAGPQRKRLVAVSTADGHLLWDREPGNLQLVLRDEAIYAAGQERTVGYKLSYATGEQIGELPPRRACTRATGTVDSVFFRASGGTVRIDVATDKAQHIAPMRPPCQDGVIVSDGLLYWGPWMCGCQLSFYGHVALGPAGRFDFRPPVDSSRLTVLTDNPTQLAPVEQHAEDWPTYLGDNARSGTSRVRLPRQANQRWTFTLPGAPRPTAPIIAGGTVYVGDESGAVTALRADNGQMRWRSYTAGPIYFPPALWHGRLYVGSADGRVYCLEAATGRALWRFQAAPAERRIPVYGRLISTWPVAGGVVAADGVVYAAAGIAHYDGTYVYALDAISGQVKWHNDASGSLSAEVDSGVSLQGNLALVDGELRFLGGGKYEVARFDIRTGKCLNEPDNSVAAQYRTAFYPYYPEYGRYVWLDRKLADGRELLYDASYEGSQHVPLALLNPPTPGAPRQVKQEARWPARGPRRQAVWADKTGRRFNAFVTADDLLLGAGDRTTDAQQPFLAAIDVATGQDAWRFDLPAAPVRAGLAVDHRATIVVTLENGQILAY
jgi:outer membrane protein assembly factor BamB